MRTINEHLKDIHREKELAPEVTNRKFRIVDPPSGGTPNQPCERGFLPTQAGTERTKPQAHATQRRCASGMPPMRLAEG